MDQESSFGAQLRARRMARGMSLSELARRCHYSKGYLSKVETGMRPPAAQLARQCDAILDGNGMFVELARATSAPPETAVLPDGPGEAWTLDLADDGSVRVRSMDRRQAITGVALLALAASLPGRTPRRETPELVAFRNIFEQLRVLGQQAAPRTVLPSLIVHTHTLRGLAHSADSAGRGELLVLAGRFAEYAGWMAQEAGQLRLAATCTDQAAELATYGGDRELAAYAHVRHALAALYADDADGAVALARRAWDGADSRRVRGLAAQREAQGHALAGRQLACFRALDVAEAQLASAEPAGVVSALGSTTVPDQVALVRGWCLVDLGRPAEAASTLDAQFGLISPTAARARARWGARRALAYAMAGEIEHACELTEVVLADGASVESMTIRSDIRLLASTLSRWLGHPPVRRIYPRLTSAMARPGS